jgi:hypothetical protein
MNRHWRWRSRHRRLRRQRLIRTRISSSCYFSAFTLLLQLLIFLLFSAPLLRAIYLEYDPGRLPGSRWRIDPVSIEA